MLLRAPFRFRGCLLARKELRRATTLVPPSVDDNALLDFFNKPHQPLSGTSTGLFRHKQITSPDAFMPVAMATMARANYIVRRIVNAREDNETRKIIKNIDRLSDLLCGIIDMAELVRHTHPEKLWVEAANNAYDVLCEYMNQLNTNVDLAKALERFMETPAFNTLPFEARQTALIFQLDFHKSGIHLPEEHRKKFVQLSSDIIAHGRDFLQGLETPKSPVVLTRQDCEGLPESSSRQWQLFALRKGMRPSISVDPESPEARRIQRYSTNEEARKKVYIAQNKSSPESIKVLEQLLCARANLAVLVGHRSYADMLLTDKMGANPEHVRMFLDSLIAVSKPRASRALDETKLAKQKRQGLQYLPEIHAWDREIYFPAVAQQSPIRLPSLSPGLAMHAFSRLMKNIYGISLRPADVLSGEVWHKDVRKLEVVDEAEGVIGWIYFDLFARHRKAGGATHYTIRCSRRVDDDDAQQDFYPDEPRELTPELEQQWVLQTEKNVTRGREGAHQRPIAVISCDLDPMPAKAMAWQDVVTLWHELGHAMHSMIGRTEYGNVAGTRCATDFVELPSILMEHFLTSPEVLSLFFPSGAPSISDTLLETPASPFRAIEAHSHILLASLDQHYHSEIALSADFDSTRELKMIQNTQGVLPYVEGTSWQTSFGHLFSYGASYYSYLFDRAIASRVWAQVFRGSPLSRENGERFKNEVLRYGGGKNAWDMTAQLLDEPLLKEGGHEAMQKVGAWGVGAEEVASGGPLA